MVEKQEDNGGNHFVAFAACIYNSLDNLWNIFQQMQIKELMIFIHLNNILIFRYLFKNKNIHDPN